MVQTVKNLPAMQETEVRSLGQEDPWRREWLPTPVFLPGEFHGQRRQLNYSPWCLKESDTTEQLNNNMWSLEGSINPPAVQETQVQSLGQEDPWRREWLPTPVFLPAEVHG